ncbi:hypothetical protein PV396_16810 [Streptomyces sp. ME02-8801-2C]|uniref:hypothetical protein n=1 Tax=Streptomyces sp. ME02-8801-2C TaxID=3028680 RepID=UPI0029B93B5C|nr:hypothetical protein [Streptomyces sp. ME02-8801-2C]MDX3453592.1 hypothetical protein [Streptomyces sp. ME02-8801-2C]
MSVLSTVAALTASRTGHAEPLTTVRHQHLDQKPFVLVPLTLAGEACAPLAALAGTDPAHPTLLTVRQPRNRAERFRFAERLATLLLAHIDGCRTETEPYTVGRGKEKAERLRCLRAPQLLVPNGEGIAYVRLLGRLTRLRATEGPYAVAPSVPTLGKWLTRFADLAEFPDSSMLLAMTRQLAAHWATGQSPSEDSHLASLLAWIDPPDGSDGARAAREAEDPAVWPPAGPATDPVFDRTLHELMTRYDEASDERAREAVGRQIDGELRGQMLPTWQLMWRGVELLRDLPEGAHVPERWAFDRRLFSEYAEYLDADGRPQARRDHAVGAARRLARLEDAVARYEAQRAYDDPLVMAEYELAGEAFTGTVTARDENRFVPGTRPGSQVWRPTITLRTDVPVELAAGTEVRSPARPGQEGRVLEVRHQDDACTVVLELKGGFARKRTPPAPPGTLAETGEELTYTTLNPTSMPASLPAEEDTPWTHGGPPRPYEPTDEDAEETWE